MHFTQEDYRKIEAWLYQRVVRDTDFPVADPLDGSESIPLIQDNKNKTVRLNELVRQIADMRLPDLYNITANQRKSWISLEEAVSLVPVAQRKLGLIITYHNENGNWMLYQFNGTSLNQWGSLNYWNSIIQQALEELLVFPDEEDITGVRDGNRTFLKFKNRDYNPEEFSGMGMIILRKNLVGTPACAIDDEDHFNNILTQDMVNQENTVYIVEYDFDLDGKVISIPKGCTLWFQGGSINNGTIYLQETAILGAFEFADMGTAKLFGKFNTGQVMTFSNDSYKAKEGGYFVATTKQSSATEAEDAKNETETYYAPNSNAYKTRRRQELRWWNGEEWLLILDITDYNEIKSVISDLIDKHNAEMAACYKYFKARCYALEVRMKDAERRLDEHDNTLADHESRIDKAETNITNIQNNITQIEENIQNIEGDITTINENITNISGDITNINNNIENITQTVTNLGDTINNLDQTINNKLEQYFETNILGATSVTVNGTKYPMDDKGNITLPNYPEPGGGVADRTKGTLKFTGAVSKSFDGSSDVTVNIPVNDVDVAKEQLTIKQGSTTLGTYDGTQEKTITIPEFPSNVSSSDKVNHKLKFTGAASGEYDGSKEVTINIPTPTSGGGNTTVSNQPLVFTGGVSKSYDGTSRVEVPIPVVNKLHVKTNNPYDINLASAEGNIDLSRMYYGTNQAPIVLAAIRLKKGIGMTGWGIDAGTMHSNISIELNWSECAMKVGIVGIGGAKAHVIGATASLAESKDKQGTDMSGNRYRSSTVGMRCYPYKDGSTDRILVQGVRTADKNNDSIDWDPLAYDKNLLSFNLIVFGYLEV